MRPTTRNSPPNSDTSDSSDTKFCKILIDEDVDDNNNDVRQFWRQRANKIFAHKDGELTSFASKRCIFNPPAKPSGYENWYNEDDESLNVYPTNNDKNEIIKAFQNNISKQIPVRVCLTQDGNRYDFGWMLPVSITGNNIMTFQGGDNVSRFAQRLLPTEETANCPSIVSYDQETGQQFNSIREVGWQRFLQQLKIPYLLEKDVPQFETDVGKYTPDFIIYPDSSLKAILEIKPAAPYADEEYKMKEVVEQTGIPGFILYGRPSAPFDNNVKYRGAMSYNHAKGAKAIKYYWDKNAGGVRRSEGYAWMSNDKRKPYLRKYQPFIVNRSRGVGKFDWKNEKIMKAYKVAQSVVDELKNKKDGDDGFEVVEN